MTKNVSLREYVERILEERDRRYEQRFASQQDALLTATKNAATAVDKAEQANTKRFESVNEFRGSLNDMQSTLMPRGEADAQFAAMSEKIEKAVGRLDKNEGIGGGNAAAWSRLLAVGVFSAAAAGVLVAVLK